MAIKMKKKKTVKIPQFSVRAGFQPDTFDEEKRTVDVVFSEGVKGKRYSYQLGEFYEELSMKKSHWNLERLNKGAPVLDNHDRWKGLNGIIGVVENARIEKGQGIATIRFSEREELQGIIADIKSGVIRNVSVGYRVHEFKDVSKKSDSIPTLRGVDIEPYEISFVDIPFDMNSQSRSQDQNEYECTIRKNEEFEMTREEIIRAACKKAGLKEDVADKIIAREFEMDTLDDVVAKEVEEMNRSVKPTTEPTVKSTIEPTVDENAVRVAAIKEERDRVDQIELAARALDVDEKEIKKHIKDGTSPDEFRALIIKAKADANAAKPTNNHNVEGKSVDTRELRIKGAERALLNRYSSAKYELNEESKQFRHITLVDLARNILEANGVSTVGMSINAIAERAMHTSSDFKEILANVTNKSLRDAYTEGPQTFGFMVNETTVNDFKEISNVQLGDAPVLEKVNENGEFKHGTISESAEKYSLQTYGKILALTRKTIVNDDLKAFTRIPALFGRSARSLESELIWAIIGSNPTMGDGNALFSAAHGNLAAGGDVGVFDVAKVGTGREAMRLQTGLDGLLIDIIPKHLVTPVALETKSEQFLGQTVPQLDSNVNPFKSKLSPVSEPRLDKYSAAAWYLASSKDQVDMIEIARLAGEEGPMISTKEGFEVDGMQIKIRYDFAATVLDWRGLYKNPGV